MRYIRIQDNRILCAEASYLKNKLIKYNFFTLFRLKMFLFHIIQVIIKKIPKQLTEKASFALKISFPNHIFYLIMFKCVSV